jgi:hypothetical protein
LRVIEHARACVQLARLVIPAVLRAVAARIGTVRACLTAHGLNVVGGLVLPPQGPSSPAGELDTAGALIAFYTDRGQAQRAEPATAKNVKRFGGQVERAGAANIAWIARPPRRLRDITRTCADR